MSVVKKLADQHEAEVAEMFGGRQTRSSGNQWHDAADGRQSRHQQRFAFAWDCKAAMPGTKSVSLTREMLEKIREQAGGERPMIPVRFYASERGAVAHDWVALDINDLAEMFDYIADLERLCDALASDLSKTAPSRVVGKESPLATWGGFRG